MTPVYKNRECVAPKIGLSSISDGTNRRSCPCWCVLFFSFNFRNGISSTLDVCFDSPDNVHSLIDDFWLVNSYDLFGPWPGSEHGQDSRPTAHIQHHLQVGRSHTDTAQRSFQQRLRGLFTTSISVPQLQVICSALTALKWLKHSCDASTHTHLG